MSSVYPNLVSAERGIAIVNAQYVMIRDELMNIDKTQTVRWNMVTHNRIQLLNSQAALIQEEGKGLRFQILQPEEAKISLASTDPKNDFEDKNPGTRMIGFEIDLKPDETKTLVVLLIPDDAPIPGQVPSQTLGNW